MEDGAFSPEGKASSAPGRGSSVSLLCGMTEEREGGGVGYKGVELREGLQWIFEAQKIPEIIE